MLGRSLAWPNPRCAKEKRLRFMFSNCFAKVSCVFLPLFVAATIMADDTPTPTVADSTRLDQGRLIYAESCQSCHGDQGQGIADGYDKPLVGDDSVGQLSSLIAETMPEGEPEQCVGDDADAVAAYIHHAFYSEAARVRNRPPRLAVTHLTANQLRQSLADLYGAFYGAAKKESTRGIRGRYFTTTKRNDENKKIAMTAPVIMDLGEDTKMSFVMPKEHSLESLPEPNSDNVELLKVAPKQFAVLTFSGYANDSKISKYSKKLIKSIRAEGIQSKGNVQFMGYNAPWQVFGRKNEVAIELIPEI